jgi:Holliday junction resolvasome RuvABC endonuclease subunit
MRVLALDIATNVGWAAGDGTKYYTVYGSHSFWSAERDHGALSYRFCLWLADKITEWQPDLVAIERGFFRGPMSYHLTGLVWDANRTAYTRGIPRVEYPPTTIKKFITGSGKSDKHDVMTAVADRGFRPETDHEADAIALLLLALDRAQQKEAA